MTDPTHPSTFTSITHLPEHQRGDDTSGMDEGTEEMAAEIHRLVWYGFHSAAEIEVFIEQSAAEDPDLDVDLIERYTVATLARKRAAEARWPKTTDNDRLDRAFERLIADGICALQAAGHTVAEGQQSVLEVLEDDAVPADRYTGYCFFHSQDMDSALDGEGLLLAFGPIDGDEKDGLEVGRRVCEALHREGLETDWNGSNEQRIGIPRLCWQRRTPD